MHQVAQTGWSSFTHPLRPITASTEKHNGFYCNVFIRPLGISFFHVQPFPAFLLTSEWRAGVWPSHVMTISKPQQLQHHRSHPVNLLWKVQVSTNNIPGYVSSCLYSLTVYVLYVGLIPIKLDLWQCANVARQQCVLSCSVIWTLWWLIRFMASWHQWHLPLQIGRVNTKPYRDHR